jgi:hypothetical protein
MAADPNVLSVTDVHEALADADGQAVAVCAVSKRNSASTVLSGVLLKLSDESSWIAKIDPGQMWSWGHDGDSINDRTGWLHDRDYGPPRNVRWGEQNDYDVIPGLSPDENKDTVQLYIPDPVFNGKGVIYYTPAPYGNVTDIETGPLVNPKQLLPEDCQTDHTTTD